MDDNNKRKLQIFMNLTKKGCVIKNYRQHLKSKMFRLENDITLLFLGCISLLRHEIQTTRQHIRFSLLAPRAICDDDKLESKQGQCSLNLASIQTWVVMKYCKLLWSKYTWCKLFLMCTKILSQHHLFLSCLPSSFLTCKDTFMDDYDEI